MASSSLTYMRDALYKEVDDPLLSDIRFMCIVDGGIVRANRSKLMSQPFSEKFRSMVSGEICQDKEEFEIQGISSLQLITLMRFMYTGSIEGLVDPNEIATYIEIGDAFEVSEFVKECVALAQKHMDSQLAFKLIELRSMEESFVLVLETFRRQHMETLWVTYWGFSESTLNQLYEMGFRSSQQLQSITEADLRRCGILDNSVHKILMKVKNYVDVDIGFPCTGKPETVGYPVTNTNLSILAHVVMQTLSSVNAVEVLQYLRDHDATMTDNTRHALIAVLNLSKISLKAILVTTSSAQNLKRDQMYRTMIRNHVVAFDWYDKIMELFFFTEEVGDCINSPTHFSDSEFNSQSQLELQRENQKLRQKLAAIAEIMKRE